MQTTLVNIVVGSPVWVEDPEVAWIDGDVFEINGPVSQNSNYKWEDGKNTLSPLTQMTHSAVYVQMCSLFFTNSVDVLE